MSVPSDCPMSDCPHTEAIVLLKERVNHPFWRLNIGHILTIVLMAVSVIGGWAHFESRQNDFARRMEDAEKKQKELDQRLAVGEDKILIKLDRLERQFLVFQTTIENLGWPKPKSQSKSDLKERTEREPVVAETERKHST